MANEDKEENTVKSSDEHDKLKKRLLLVKKDCFSSIQKIEDEYNSCLNAVLTKNKKIMEFKNADKKKLFEEKILDESLFDRANLNVYFEEIIF
jgi:hypothetical protein